MRVVPGVRYTQSLKKGSEEKEEPLQPADSEGRRLLRPAPPLLQRLPALQRQRRTKQKKTPKDDYTNDGAELTLEHFFCFRHFVCCVVGSLGFFKHF